MHVGFTMEQVQTHYNAVMAEKLPAPAPLLMFLKQHRLAEGQIDGEHASEEVVAAMNAMNPNFVAE